MVTDGTQKKPGGKPRSIGKLPKFGWKSRPIGAARKYLSCLVAFIVVDYNVVD